MGFRPAFPYASALTAGVALASLALSAQADVHFAAPKGEVVLTVTGDISRTNAPDMAQFDMAHLMDLTPTSITTTTPWTDGTVTFTGVSLADLCAFLGIETGTLHATALNLYEIEIPVTDAWEAGPIIAYLRDGAPMSVRDKGPLWVIYPFDDLEKIIEERYTSRAIWQLTMIDVDQD